MGEKATSLFDTFDFNMNGTMMSDKTEIIIRDVVTVAGTVVPAVKLGISFEEAQKKTEEDTKRCVEKATRIIFEKEDYVYKEQLADALE